MAVLETSSTAKTRENSKKMPKTDKKQPKKVLLVAQELKLARILAGNNKTARDRALKSLKKWFQNRSATIPFTDNDFLRLWKGLFYSMWMSDKPLIQEECAESISSLLHSLPLETSLLFYKCGMRILMNEWFGIDQLRLDKFLMFVRRLLRQVLFVLRNDNWSRKSVQKFTQCLSETILDTESHRPMGLLMHFVDIFPEELAKVADGGLPPQLVTQFLIPFIKQLAFNDDSRITDHIRQHVFYHLIRQSDLGLEYEEKYRAWRSLGFPGSIDSMQKIEVSDEEREDDEEEEENVNKVYDPRAGRVDVELPPLKFHSKAIAKALSEYKFAKNTNSKTRKCLNDLSEQFKKLASGVYPLGVKTVKLATNTYDTSLKKAVNRLVKFDKKIKGQKKSKKRKPQEDLTELRNGKKIKLDNDANGLQEKLLKNMKQKRKNPDFVETPPPEKLKKLEIESIFRRNSGTWLVSKTEGEENSRESLFPRSEFEISERKEIDLDATLIQNPFANLSPAKKVKINIKLNRSQDVQEHHAQILSSPAIPYDANKKPAKPLLKTPVKRSPINPFYGLS